MGETPSLFGPATNADLSRWQRRNYDTLGLLLKRHPDWPVIDWTVTPFALVGRCPAKGAGQRMAFERWSAALGLKVSEPLVTVPGFTRLFAMADLPADDAGHPRSVVKVAVRADILNEDEADE